MHLARAGVAQHLYDLLARRAAHDGVVDDDDPFAAQHVGLRVQLHLDAEVADGVARLDEGAADVVVADEPHLERQLGLLGKAQRRRHAGIGYADGKPHADAYPHTESAAHAHENADLHLHAQPQSLSASGCRVIGSKTQAFLRSP